MPMGDRIRGFGNRLASGNGGGKCEYMIRGFVLGVGDGMNGLVDSIFTGEFLGDMGEPVLRHVSREKCDGVF